MEQFEVHIDGMKEFKQKLASDDSLATIIPDITIAILHFHDTLEKRVNDLFAVPYSLSRVLAGGRGISTITKGTHVTTELRYNMKAIPLVQYPTQSYGLTTFSMKGFSADVSSKSISSAPVRMKDGGVIWIKGMYSQQYLVEVRRVCLSSILWILDLVH
jgi:hypothetical protein